MPKDDLPKITLRYDGLFDFDGLYAALTSWAKNYGYKWHEATYKHKVPGAGAEKEWAWQMTKVVTEYISYDIIITVHSWDFVDVNVEKGGKKKKLTNSRLYFNINSSVTHDQAGIFKKSPRLGKIYNKLTRRNIDAYLDQLYYRVWNLHGMLKKFFDMQAKANVYKGYLGEN